MLDLSRVWSCSSRSARLRGLSDDMRARSTSMRFAVGLTPAFSMMSSMFSGAGVICVCCGLIFVCGAVCGAKVVILPDVAL